MRDALLLIGGIVGLVLLVAIYALAKAKEVPKTFLDEHGWENADEQ